MEEIDTIGHEKLTQPSQQELDDREQEILNWIDALANSDEVTREAIEGFALMADDKTILQVNAFIEDDSCAGLLSLGRVIKDHVMGCRRKVATAKTDGEY